jgi:ABC-type uncharacterized transport system permease subunit
VLLGVTNLVQCHQMWEIAAEIKEGRFSAFLIRPFSYQAMHYIAFLSWRLMRTTLFVPIFALALLLFRDQLGSSEFSLRPAFFVSLVLGHFVSFLRPFPLACSPCISCKRARSSTSGTCR